MEGGDLVTMTTAAAQVAPPPQPISTSAATAGAPTPQVPEQSGDTRHTSIPFRRGQQLAFLERLAQNLLDETLNEALDVYLRRQVQPTADETIRAAFAEATGGTKRSRQEMEVETAADTATGMDRNEKEEDASELESLRASLVRAIDTQASQADDEYDEQDEDDDTLNTLHLHPSSPSRSLRQSVSPCRLDGGSIFQDLSEMSNFADRIDSILDQSASEHSTRSGGGGNFGMRSASPFAPVSQDGQQNYEADNEVD